MKQTGIWNAEKGIETTGLTDLSALHWNLTEPELTEEAIRRSEGRLVAGGAFAVDTGVHTGRSPSDKFVVRDATTERTVWWENTKALTPAQFETLYADFVAHARGKELFVQDLVGGADTAHALPTRVVTEYAWHSSSSAT